MRKLATRLEGMTGEGALMVFKRAQELERQGRSIIHLEIGEPDYHPAAPVVDAVRAAVAAGRDRYTASRGLLQLREAVAEYLQRTRKLTARAENVLVGPGCKPVLALAMMALVESGDEVLYPDPGFPIYPSLARGLGARPVPYRLLEKNAFQPDIEEIEARITPRTSVLLMNSPNNPTGSVYSDAVQKRLAELAVRHDLWVVTDEIYARILYGGEFHSISLLPGMAERTIILDGFSKSFAMTGWRLGYAVAPVKIMDAFDLLVMNLWTSVNEFTQVAAVEALRDSVGAVTAMVAEYRKRRDAFAAGLNAIPGFRCLPPEGAFYAWVNVEETGVTAKELGHRLLEEAGVAGIAGTAFGEEGKNFLRFSFASATPLLEAAIERMKALSNHWRAAVAR
jgi:aspartate/methionine/tyrosine aminotransferase